MRVLPLPATMDFFHTLGDQRWTCGQSDYLATESPSLMLGDRALSTRKDHKTRSDTRSLTMDSEVEVAAVKLVLGGHLAAVAPRRSGLSVCDVQLKQVDLWAGDGGSQGSHIQSLYCVIYREDLLLKTHDWACRHMNVKSQGDG